MKRWFFALPLPGVCAVLGIVFGQSCASNNNNNKSVSSGSDAGTHVGTDGAVNPLPSSYCALPGSIVFGAQGSNVIPGAPADAGTDLSWVTVPAGFCVHAFATLGHVRQMRFAPGGDLFATSPTAPTAGGNSLAGNGTISIFPDDDGDGYSDGPVAYMSSLASTQGILFANNALYYQDDATIRSVPFTPGDRSPSGDPVEVTTITAPQDEVHWTKVMDQARDGTIYVTNGGSQEDECLSTDPVRGSIYAVTDGGGNTLVAKGFRNPIALRCEPDHDICLAIELGLDYSGFHNGREKIVPVRSGDDWGFPCCATANLPYEGVIYHDTGDAPDCGTVAAEDDSFVIGQTPFGLDFETGKWPAPWTNRIFVTMHGAAGTWQGAGIVASPTNPDSGAPILASDLGDGGGPAATSLLTFAGGWDDNKQDHGRPAAVAFSPDGRMFVGDDIDGVIFWVAPVGLQRP